MSKVVSGARAVVQVVPSGANTQAVPVGIFNSCSYGLTFDAQPAFILGRYSAAEISYTAQEPVQVTCSGWRVVGSGPHKAALVPSLSDLMTHEYIQLVLFDRQENLRIAVIKNVRPTGYSTTVSARQLEEITVTFVGILVDDENTTNDESAGYTNLP